MWAAVWWIIWYRSARKAQLDAEIRYKRLENAAKALSDLKAKLASPRTRYRDRAKVAQAVETILREAHAESMLEVTIQEQTIENFRQEQRGRPTPKTRYVKSETTRFDLTWKLEYDLLVREAFCDGIFPLTTNDPHLSALELLLARIFHRGSRGLRIGENPCVFANSGRNCQFGASLPPDPHPRVGWKSSFYPNQPPSTTGASEHCVRPL